MQAIINQVSTNNQVNTFQAPVQQAPIQQAPVQPGVVFFASAADPKFGFLTNNFPVGFVGTNGGTKYFSVNHYMAEKIVVALRGGEPLRLQVVNHNCNPIKDGNFDWQAVDAAHTEIGKLCAPLLMNPQNLQVWAANMTNVVRQALLYKFCQNEKLLELLLATGDDFLVYASSSDAYLGIGIDEGTAKSGKIPIEQWGQNILGNLLMQLRGEIRKNGRPKWAYTMSDAHQRAQQAKRDNGLLAALLTVEPTLKSSDVVVQEVPKGKEEEEPPKAVEIKVEDKKEEAKKEVQAESADLGDLFGAPVEKKEEVIESKPEAKKEEEKKEEVAMLEVKPVEVKAEVKVEVKPDELLSMFGN